MDNVVTALNPVERLHPLAQATTPMPAGDARGFIPPPPDVALAKSMQDAIGRYPELQLGDSAEDWINEAKALPGFEYLSASMLVATFVTMRLARTDRPTMNDVRQHADVVLAPYQDIRLPPEDQEELRIRQLADLWRYTKKVIQLRSV